MRLTTTPSPVLYTIISVVAWLIACGMWLFALVLWNVSADALVCIALVLVGLPVWGFSWWLAVQVGRMLGTRD